jgi:hypothetical protein
MEEIKREFENPETQINTLELIEQHKGAISPYAFFFIAKDFRIFQSETYAIPSFLFLSKTL